jgi:hypothetical protein
MAFILYARKWQEWIECIRFFVFAERFMYILTSKESTSLWLKRHLQRQIFVLYILYHLSSFLWASFRNYLFWISQSTAYILYGVTEIEVRSLEKALYWIIFKQVHRFTFEPVRTIQICLGNDEIEERCRCKDSRYFMVWCFRFRLVYIIEPP